MKSATAESIAKSIAGWNLALRRNGASSGWSRCRAGRLPPNPHVAVLAIRDRHIALMAHGILPTGRNRAAAAKNTRRSE